LQLKIFYNSFPETSKCPSCGKIGTIRRSRSRSVFESAIKLMKIFGIYKCKECGWRGILRKYMLNRYSYMTILFYSGLVFTAAYIISKVLKMNFGPQ
jgi:predicted RNA-binding Zn-ribbon protein involved in translation (DUF1610 family)